MGRRAKNKQEAPAPFQASPFQNGKKSNGKRKADDDEAPRPLKKAKEFVEGSSVKSKSKSKTKENEGDANPAKKSKSKKPKISEEEEWGAEGWEDVEEDNLATAAQCVFTTNAEHNLRTDVCHRDLFNDSDGDEAHGFTGDLNDLDDDDELDGYAINLIIPNVPNS